MPPSPKRRKKAERFGRLGEVLAALYLRCLFFRIRATRVKTPAGEIDLVASRGSLLVFVEVKTRRSGQNLEDALMAVNTRRIVQAARHYLMRNPALATHDIRFDVIFLAPGALPSHLRNAFQDGS